MTPDDFRAARLRLGMTQAALAEALGYSAARVVSAIETGNRNPGPTAIKLLQVLLNRIASLEAHVRFLERKAVDPVPNHKRSPMEHEHDEE